MLHGQCTMPQGWAGPWDGMGKGDVPRPSGNGDGAPVSSYLAVQQLSLWPSVAFDLIADAVEERDPELLLIAPAELAQHLPRPLCSGTARPR